MKERIDAVLDSTARLQEIRTRITAIDAERAALETEAAEIMQRIGVGHAADWKDARLPLPRRIISFFASRPTEQFRVSAIGQALGMTHRRDLQTLRGTLSRLTWENRIARIGPWTYMGKPGVV